MKDRAYSHPRHHLQAMLYKNWLYHRRTRLLSFFELALPVLLMLTLLVTRIAVSLHSAPALSYQGQIWADNI